MTRSSPHSPTTSHHPPLPALSPRRTLSMYIRSHVRRAHCNTIDSQLHAERGARKKSPVRILRQVAFPVPQYLPPRSQQRRRTGDSVNITYPLLRCVVDPIIRGWVPIFYIMLARQGNFAIGIASSSKSRPSLSRNPASAANSADCALSLAPLSSVAYSTESL